MVRCWSGRGDSNPRNPAWKAGALDRYATSANVRRLELNQGLLVTSKALALSYATVMNKTMNLLN